MTAPAPSRLFRFGVFEADVENARLARKGVRIRLQEQPFRILAMLLERAGQIVAREELRKELWPSGTYVDFDGSLNAALKRLRMALDDDADNPRFIETVPKRGYRFIAPVVMEEHSIEAAAEPTASAQFPVFTPSPGTIGATPSAKSKNLWRIAAISAAFLVSAAIAALIVRRDAKLSHGSPSVPVVRAEARRSVAVLGFHNVSGRAEDAWLSTALTEMLRTELGAGNKLRVVAGEDVAQFRLATPWSETDSLSPETSAKIGRALEGDLLVLGSYVTVGDPQGGAIRVDFRLQQSQTGEILFEGADAGTEKQLFSLIAKIGLTLRQRLQLPLVSESEEVSVLSSLPADVEAARFYSLGLAKMRDGDLAAARALFLQAEKITPDFPLIHTMLSRCWGGLGYDQNARTEAKKAFNLSRNLPQPDRLLVEATYYDAVKDSEKAAATYRALYALYPDSVDYAEHLIVTLNSMGRREEALTVIKQLRQLPPPESEDPRIDFWEAKLVSYRDGVQVSPLLDRAISKAAASGQKLLYARFRLDQCLGLIYSDKPQSATASCEEAYQIFLGAGNRLQAADALRIMGDRRGSEGNFQGATELYEKALSMLRELGEHEKTGAVLNNMAIAYENQGQIDRSERLFLEAEQNFKEVGDVGNMATAIANIADIRLERGDLHEAEKSYLQAEDLGRKASGLESFYAFYSVAEVRLFEGDMQGAERFAKQSYDAAQSSKRPADLSIAVSALGDVALAQGNLQLARENYERALEIRKPLEDKNLINEGQAQLAGILLEESKPAEAETILRKCISNFHSENTVMDEIRADTDLARALRMQGKLAEAQTIISAAVRLSRPSQDPSLKLPVLIEDARVKTALLVKSRGPLAPARSEIQNAIRTAGRLGYFGIECEARLAMAQLEQHSNAALAESHFSAIESDAHAHGLDLIARKAGTLAKTRMPTAKSPAI